MSNVGFWMVNGGDGVCENPLNDTNLHNVIPQYLHSLLALTCCAHRR
jgi:hypothetical protein